MTWERRRRDRSVTAMLIPRVTELPRRLEPVTRDDFADDGEPPRAGTAGRPHAPPGRSRRRSAAHSPFELHSGRSYTPPGTPPTHSTRSPSAPDRSTREVPASTTTR
jgi:hypothetical protein